MAKGRSVRIFGFSAGHLTAPTLARWVRRYVKGAFDELNTAPGKANFTGFIIVGLFLLPLLGYTILSQIFPRISARVVFADLTIVPPEPTVLELVIVILTIMAWPFLFALCVSVFEAVDEDGNL